MIYAMFAGALLLCAQANPEQDPGRVPAISLREWVLLLVQNESERTDLLVDRQGEVIDALEARISAQFAAQERALALASDALTIRLEHSNGLIAAAQQKENEFARRSEMLSLVGDTERRLASLEQYRATQEGEREGGQTLLSIVMLIVGAVVAGAVGLLFLRLANRKVGGAT